MPADLESRLAGLRALDYLPPLADPADLRHTVRHRRRRERLIGAGLLALVVAVAIALAVVPHRPHVTPVRPPTPGLSGPVLLTGHITTDGRPTPDVIVYANLWPNSSAESALPPGGVVTTLTVETATDSAGNYRVVLDPTAVPAMYWEGPDVVNVEVDLSYDRGNAGWNLPITRCGDAWCDDSGATPRLDFDLGQTPTVTQDGDNPQPLPTQ